SGLSQTVLVATVPAGAVTRPLTYAARYSTAKSAGTFTVLVAPRVTGVTPTGGAPGTAVTLTGSALDALQSVTFNNVRATVTSITATRLVATVPATATTGPLVVRTTGGSASAGTFTVTTTQATDTPSIS